VAASSTDLPIARAIYRESKRRILGEMISGLGATGFLSPSEPDAIGAQLREAAPRSLADFGCGNARLGLLMARRLGCGHYLGIDRDERILSQAAAEAPASEPRCSFRPAAFEDTGPQAERPFDAILSHDAIYLNAAPPLALRGVANNLQEGGLLVATLYVGDVEEGGIRRRRLDDWLTWLAAAGLQVVQCNDLTDEWRHWAGCVHRERLALCEAAPDGIHVSSLAAISRRMLGLDGGLSFLSQVQRFRISACLADASREDSGS